MSRDPYDPMAEIDGSLDSIADSLHAIAGVLTERHETASAPICGAHIVTREVEGMAADIEVCRRTGGQCPWRKKNGALAGLRASVGDCAAINEEQGA